MKKLYNAIALLLFIQFLLPRCANPGRPSGGPTDTIPPSLLSSAPAIGTKNYDGQTLSLEFTEYVNADKIQQQLIITPRTDITYKTIVKRNRLIIKLSEPLNDSTTYNFNFAAGVTDITEKNPATNLSVAFSTGPTIDSLSVEGRVEDLLTQKPSKKHLVGLYPYTDSLDYFADKPLYFTTTNDTGYFTLNYLKAGKYKILSYEDANNNQTLDPKEESHAFKPGLIALDSPIAFHKPLRSLLQDIKPIEIISVRPAALYVEARANKHISSYTVTPDRFYHQIVGENSDVIRIYKPDSIAYADSVTFFIKAADSLSNVDYDTTTTVFLESNRKIKPLAMTSASQDVTWKDTIQLSLQFDKPIIAQEQDSLTIKIDSVHQYRTPFTTNWNSNRTQAEITSFISTDSVLSYLAATLPPDTIRNDSSSTYQLRPIPPDRLISQIPLQIQIPPSTFISVESDTTNSFTWRIAQPQQPKGGTLIITLDTNESSYIFQLLKAETPIYSVRNKAEFTLSNVSPGTYRIRVLIDSNNDGNWTYGNLMQDKAPEEIYLYPTEISVRENWENTFQISF